MGHSEPVLAQLMTVSTVVVTTPFSSMPWFAIGNFRNQRRGGATGGSLPVERALLPLVDEAHHQDGQEDHHGPEAHGPDLPERHGPGEEEGDLQVEQDEQDGDEVVA